MFFLEQGLCLSAFLSKTSCLPVRLSKFKVMIILVSRNILQQGHTKVEYSFLSSSPHLQHLHILTHPYPIPVCVGQDTARAVIIEELHVSFTDYPTDRLSGQSAGSISSPVSMI